VRILVDKSREDKDAIMGHIAICCEYIKGGKGKGTGKGKWQW